MSFFVEMISECEKASSLVRTFPLIVVAVIISRATKEKLFSIQTFRLFLFLLFSKTNICFGNESSSSWDQCYTQFSRNTNTI